MAGSKSDFNTSNFDEILGTVGDPATAEVALNIVLSQAEKLSEKSIYLQILSQLALVQAMQKKFSKAEETIKKAETLLSNEPDPIARSRILLEKGRIFHQKSLFCSANSEESKLFLDEALKYFELSYHTSEAHDLDYHTANAAHMLGIAAHTADEKIRWNLLAMKFAEQSKDVRANSWLPALCNNLGQVYLDAGKHSLALDLFRKALDIREREGIASQIRIAKWALGHALRIANEQQEALALLLSIEKEYEAIATAQTYDIPQEAFRTIRGLVYEDLAELETSQTKIYAAKAYADLSQVDWMQLAPYKHRLERLRSLMNDGM